MPAAPPEPTYWFSQVVEGVRISALIFARVAGSVSRLTIASRPPSRAHTGRLASSGLLPAMYGYWSAAMSRPSCRARSMRCSTAGMRPQFCL